ncbi:MAG: hypothetical protein M3495_17740, partial [Pseudomonadota bacterium]|nr:hypothetical protein [Pseudomonadota bacterium]
GRSSDGQPENRRQEGRIEQRAIAHEGLIHDLRHVRSSVGLPVEAMLGRKIDVARRGRPKKTPSNVL